MLQRDRLTRRAKQWHKGIIAKSEMSASAAGLGLMMSFDPDEVQSALRKAWSLATASQWTASNPAAGQCNVTSLLIHELFGGELLRTPLPAGDHFTIALEAGGTTSRRASSISRLLTRICPQAVPMWNWERQAMNWPNSEPLFRSVVRSKAKGRSQTGERSGRGESAEHQFARRSLLMRRMTTTPSSDQSKLWSRQAGRPYFGAPTGFQSLRALLERQRGPPRPST